MSQRNLSHLTKGISNKAFQPVRQVRSFSAASMASTKLLVVGNKDRAELEVLKKLPTGVDIVKVGTDFSDVSDEELAQVDSVLLGAGPTGGTRKHLQAIWGKLPNLKWMHSNMAGLDFFLCPEIVESDVVITNSKGVFSQSLAEYALFSCKYFALNAPRLLAQKKAKHWEQFTVQELSGKTLGIVGYGDIGRCTGALAKGFGMKVLASRRNPKLSSGDGIVDEMFAIKDLNSMVAQCDYVVACTPLTPETKGMINAEVFKSMKPTAVFVNIGRGPCVDEASLVEALQTGQILGAGLDVFEVEPLPKTSPLWDMDNVFVSSHNADQVDGWLNNSIQLFVDNMERYLKKEDLVNIVDTKRGY